MTLLGLLVAGVLGWLLFTGRLAWPNARQVAALVLALAGGAIAARGRVLVGGGMAFLGLLWLAKAPPRAKAPPPVTQVGLAGDGQAREALELLGLPLDADRAAVIEAHRRLITRNHPDAGGTEALARNINAARDYLLGRLPL